MCDDINRKTYVLDHIFYEFEMYLITYYELSVYTFFKNQLTKNLLIESHQIHLRILLDFFYIIKKLPSTIVVTDILANYTPIQKNGEFWNAKRIINKSIAHLTFSRIPPKKGNNLTQKTQKNIKKMFPIIKEKIENFLCNLNDENIPIGQYKKNIQESLKASDILLRINSLKMLIKLLEKVWNNL